MQQQNTWLRGPEVAEALAVRQSRIAQCARAGLLPYVECQDYILFHKSAVVAFANQFPELLLHFRAEFEVDKVVESGELIFECLNFPPPSTVALLKSVERFDGSFPSSRRVRRK